MKKFIDKIFRIPVYYFLRKLVNNSLLYESQDLSRAMQLIAREESARYVMTNMANVNSASSRLEVLNFALEKVSIDGVFLEFGVYSGSSINHIASKTKSKVIGFDSFEGLPERWRDGFLKGAFNVHSTPKVAPNASLIKGWFFETLPEFSSNNKESLAFVHIDCDLYSSTKEIFHYLGSQIKVGTIIVFDEYFNYPGWRDGEFKAFKEFLNQYSFSYEYITYNKLNEQVAVRII